MRVTTRADSSFRSQATFHAGYPLASTLWACNYLRADSLAAVSGFAPSTSASADDKQSQLRTVVLRALLLGVVKSSQIVWEELGKSQVYEVRPARPPTRLAHPLRETLDADSRTPRSTRTSTCLEGPCRSTLSCRRATRRLSRLLRRSRRSSCPAKVRTTRHRRPSASSRSTTSCATSTTRCGGCRPRSRCRPGGSAPRRGRSSSRG